MIRKLFTLLTATLASVSLMAQPKLIEKVEAQEGKLIIPYAKYELENGLTVILHQDHADPIIHVNVTYHVGSARETPKRSGFAHFFEHMMFQGSDNVEDDEHFKIVQRAGGNMNGTTNRDRTNYFETLPANYLETALWLEADRMGFLLDAVTEKAFENQRSTVKNEKGQNYLSRPYGLIDEVKDQDLYPQGHPYSWPTIGYTDDLDSATVEDLKNFFLRWYGPNNAILTIAGDFKTEPTLKLVEKYFGSIKQGPAVKKQIVARPNIANDKYSTIEDDIFLPLTQFVYSSVPNYHRDEAALDMLADIMGGGNNSIFYRNFVKSEKALQAVVANPCFELAGEFTIAVLAYPTETLEETEQLIRKTITDFEKEVLMSGEMDDLLAQAKAEMKTNILGSFESLQGKAGSLSSWHMLLSRPYNVQDDLDRYDAVTKEEVIRVFNRYIKGKKAVITNVIRYTPKEGEEGEEFEKVSNNPYAHLNYPTPAEYSDLKYIKAEDKFDRGKHPVTGEAKAAVVPSYFKGELANGLKIIGTETSDLPVINMFITIKGGHIMDDNGYEDGTANLTAAMMEEGTKNYTTEEISAALKRIGTFINFNVTPDATNISVTCQKYNLDETLKLLEEKILRPRFAEDDFKRVKKQMLESIKDQRTNPDLTAFKAYNNLIYGNSVLGRFYTGTYQTVDKIKLDDVKSFHAKHYAPNLTNMVIVGDVSEKDLMEKMKRFETWEKKDVTMPEITDFPKYEGGPQILLIDQLAAPQSKIRVGHISAPYDYNGIHFKSTVMNFALGGNFSSRINLNLREDKGFTYGARSYFTGNEYPGAFTVSTSVRTSSTDTSVTEIMKEIEKYRTTGITEDELEFTKSSLLLSDILEYETSFQKARFLNQVLRYNLPDDYIKQQEGIVTAMTKDEIDKLAKAQINPDNMIILVVGNSYVIKKRLEKLGYGKVKELDVNDIKLKEFKN